MALPGIIIFLFFIYIRPQEFIEGLSSYNFLYIALGLAVLGMVYDLGQSRLRLTSTPLLMPALVFSGWCVFTIAVNIPNALVERSVPILVALVLYLIMGHGVQRITNFYRVVVTIFMLGFFVAYVGADQSISPYQCCMSNPSERNGSSFPDGRECRMQDEDGTPHDGDADCIAGGRHGMAYVCERAGLLGTTSIRGRVRYLGVLLDPNELALATALAVPFAFALVEIRSSFLRVSLLLITLVIVAMEIIATKSRGGQVSFGMVLGAYFVKKYGWRRGVVVAAILAAPLLLLGGRSDQDADASTLERLGCSAAGIKMMLSRPIVGIGQSRFPEHHYLTAHNAYILAVGELGLPGAWLFLVLMFIATKIPYTVMRFPMPGSEETTVMKALAMAMLATFLGAWVGIFFLSWTYHYVLWIHFGMAAALYASVKRIYPSFSCRLTFKEGYSLFFGFVAFLMVWTVYIRYKGAWDD